MSQALLSSLPWIVAAVFVVRMIAPKGDRPAALAMSRRSRQRVDAVSGGSLGGRRALLRPRGRRVQRSDELPQLADLLAIGLSAGLTIRLALLAVADLTDPPAAGFVRAAAADLRSGKGLASALSGPVCGSDRSGDLVDDGRLSGLSAVLIVADRAGAGAIGVLARYAEHERQLCRRAREERLRRLPVRLLPPLVVCVLPAFVLCTVVPIAVAVGRSLRFPG